MEVQLGRGRKTRRVVLAEALQTLLGRPVQFLNDCVGPEVEAACAKVFASELVWRSSDELVQLAEQDVAIAEQLGGTDATHGDIDNQMISGASGEKNGIHVG
jgi:3-phosphoglycerate kinase